MQQLKPRGQVRLENGTGMEGVCVLCTNTPPTFTDDAGFYQFEALTPGLTYQVLPLLEGNPLEGVNVADMILIRDHLLDLNPLENSYRRVAADVDNSQSINISDLIFLRQLILGFINIFPNGTPVWRFLPVAIPLSTPALLNEVPAYSQGLIISSLETDSLQVDFWGIKTGDVNESIDNLFGPIEPDLLMLSNTQFEAGEDINLPIQFKQAELIKGYQFVLNYDQRFLSFVPEENRVAGAPYLRHDPFNGQIHLLWYQEHTDGQINVPSLHFKAKKAGSLANVLEVDSESTALVVRNSEAHSIPQLAWGSDEWTEFRQHSSSPIRLNGNFPNPFTGKTQLWFDLQSDQDIELWIYSSSGKLIQKNRRFFNQGTCNWEIDLSHIPESGVFYYHLITEADRIIGKLIKS